MARGAESPAVARRRLRVALREAREAASLTQGQVAQELDWSLSKVNRIESGEVTVSRTDLQALMRLYDITAPARQKELIEEAKLSRQRGWWHDPSIRGNLTPAMIQLLQFEESAQVIRLFQATLIPGPLQTAPYAETVLSFWKEELTAEERATRAAVRTKRLQRLTDRDNTPQIFALLDESVLLRNVGGPEVMLEQLEHLLRLSHEPHITFRVIPLADAAPMLAFGAFYLWDLGDGEQVLYRESHILDEVIDNSAKIDRHRRMFEQMWQLGRSEDETRREVEQRVADLRATSRR